MRYYFINFIFLIIFILVIKILTNASIINSNYLNETNNNKNNNDFPSPYSKNNRLVSFILSYDNNHVDPLMLIFNEYKTMCESGWNVTIIIFTTFQYRQDTLALFNQKLYCFRTNSFVPLQLIIHEKSIGIYLSEQHRLYLVNHYNDFDVFVYHEDDLIFQYNHLIAYLTEINILASHYTDRRKALKYYCIGFQRYWRESLLSGDKQQQSYSPKNVSESELLYKDFLDEKPNFSPLCINNYSYVVADGIIITIINIIER